MQINKVHKILTVKIRDEISTERKLDLIGLTILESEYDNILNPMLLDIFFKVNMILVYTDIKISDEERLDKVQLYDFFKKNNLWEDFVKEINEVYPGELEYMQTGLAAWAEEYKRYSNSILSVINVLKDYLNNLLQNFEGTAEAFKNVDWAGLSEIEKIAQNFNIDLDESVKLDEK